MLRRLDKNALAYNRLASHDSPIPPLSSEHANLMWSLVDYSTISNEVIPAASPTTTTTAVPVPVPSSATILHYDSMNQLSQGRQQEEDIFLSSNNADLWFDSWVDLFAAGDSNAGVDVLGMDGHDAWQS